MNLWKYSCLFFVGVGWGTTKRAHGVEIQTNYVEIYTSKKIISWFKWSLLPAECDFANTYKGS